MNLPSDLPATAALTPEQQLAHDIALVMQSATQQHHAGQYDEAQTLYEAILSAVPEHADANYNLAVLKVQTGKPGDAVPHFEVALGSKPDNGNYWVSYINALHQSGQSSAAWVAVEIAQQRGFKGPAFDGLITQMAAPEVVLQTAPVAPAARAGKADLQIAADSDVAPDDSADADGSLRITRRPSKQDLGHHAALYAKGRHDEAVAYARELTKRFPDDGPTWRALTVSLHKTGQFKEMLDAGARALELLPEEVLTRVLVADTLRLMDRHTEAEAMCRRILELKDDNVEGVRILSLVLSSLRRREESLAAARRAVELGPQLAITNSTLGFVLLEHGDTNEARHWLKRALSIDPSDAATFSTMLFCLTHNDSITPQELLESHREFAKTHRSRVRAHTRHDNNRDPERKLKIALISGDLFHHAVASYLTPVVEHLRHDPRVELTFYSNHVQNDVMTDRLRACAYAWREVTGLSDRAVADMIRRDRIDIAIDLSGHTGRNRLVALMHKPAPVQASWIGYPATTGIEAMDYYLADRFLAPPGELDDQFVEKIVRLPAIAPFMPPPNCPPINGLPALRNGYVTYGSFNRLNKLRADVVELWARVLRADPTSRMVLGATSNDADRKAYLDWFGAQGVAAERLEFRPRASPAVYLQQHHHVDLCLDTFPYAGSTTTLNALWMGVPTLTMPGATMPSRGGACWLNHLGLSEYIARDKDEFVEKALTLPRATEALNVQRLGMRERCLASAAFQPATVAAGLSAALRTMWRRWCTGAAPVSFDAQLPADWQQAVAADA